MAHLTSQIGVSSGHDCSGAAPLGAFCDHTCCRPGRNLDCGPVTGCRRYCRHRSICCVGRLLCRGTGGQPGAGRL